MTWGQAEITGDQMTMYKQTLQQMCIVSLVSVPLFSWMTTYAISGLAGMAGWLLLSVVLGIIVKTFADRVWKPARTC
jgi:uncharacterized membrane protein (DUF106 family)